MELCETLWLNTLMKIAILYNKHKLCIPILRLLQSKNIPVNIHKSDNIFDVSEIAFLIRALTYIQREMESPFSADDDLFKLLHAPFFGLNSVILAEKVYEIKIKSFSSCIF